jgi:hypothetical protein
MCHLGIWGVLDAPPCSLKPPAKIDVLDIHEVGLIPTADLVESLSPKPNGSTGYPIDTARYFRVALKLAVATSRLIIWPYRTK